MQKIKTLKQLAFRTSVQKSRGLLETTTILANALFRYLEQF